MSENAVLITGGAGSGKSSALIERALAQIAAHPELPLRRFIVTSPLPGGGALREALRTRLPAERLSELDSVPWLGGELHFLAHAILAENALRLGVALDIELIGDDAAEVAFERAGASLFALEWGEFVSDEIDPELSGMRAPERFAAAALRLFRKLRSALISPDEFLDRALRGAVAWYAMPPNFANPDLLQATREEYRESLNVDGAELERQRTREVDLAKVLARLYRSYLDELVAAGCLTAVDAIAEATRALAEHPDLAERYRAEFVAAFVDDAQDLTLGALRFLQRLFGEELNGVTFAADRDQATQTLAGARPDAVLRLRAENVALESSFRLPPPIATLARSVAAAGAFESPAAESVDLYRARTQEDEAQYVAEAIAKRLERGAAPGEIALVLRSFVWMRPYRDALIARGVRVRIEGTTDLFDEPDVEDALALLWSACDPFRHDWLLRAIGGPAARVSDLVLHVLCGEPSSMQTALFELPDDEDSIRGRWDRRRNLRLALNVVRGDRDADLDPAARDALTVFRERRERWESLLLDVPAEEAAALIVAEGGLRLSVEGENEARRALRDALLDALVGRVRAFVEGDRRRTLHDFLQFAERSSLADKPPFARIGTDGVVLGSVEAVKGRSFAHVFVPNLRAGAFPAYYSPDAFLFSPKEGVIPKDNVGDAATTRTAKFTWYSHRAKLKEQYAQEDRRALYCAITRARESVTLTAFGRPTRGIGAPEFLAELQGARPARAF